MNMSILCYLHPVWLIVTGYAQHGAARSQIAIL